MATKTQSYRTNEESASAPSQASSEMPAATVPLPGPAEQAIARFEANLAVRATAWILPRLNPTAAASEPHAANMATANPIANTSQ